MFTPEGEFMVGVGSGTASGDEMLAPKAGSVIDADSYKAEELD